MIELNKIKIDGGTQLTHKNYVIGFSDGTVKVGTTSRGTKRVQEIVKKKLKDQNCKGVVSFFLSDLRTRNDAYRVERDTCFLVKSYAIKGTREWFKSEALFLEQTVGMFSHGVSLRRGRV